MDHGLIEGDICNRNGCKGIMGEIEDDTCCSCHINPPCSHCVDMCYRCSECEFETETPECAPALTSKKANPCTRSKTHQEAFDELSETEFGYVTIAGKYYWMEYRGKYPEGMSPRQILDNFNVCFGFKWLRAPSNGIFHLKVYTD